MRTTEGSVSGFIRCWSYIGTFFIGLNLPKFSSALTKTTESLVRRDFSCACSKRYEMYLKMKARISAERLRVRDSAMTSWASWKTSFSYYVSLWERRLWQTTVSFQSASMRAGGFRKASCMKLSRTPKYSGSKSETREKRSKSLEYSLT